MKFSTPISRVPLVAFIVAVSTAGLSLLTAHAQQRQMPPAWPYAQVQLPPGEIPPQVAPCAVCHGAELKGLGPVPNLAGRSPSYLARQMYDMKLGTRKGALSALMMPVLANLTDADIIDLIAFIASREP